MKLGTACFVFGFSLIVLHIIHSTAIGFVYFSRYIQHHSMNICKAVKGQTSLAEANGTVPFSLFQQFTNKDDIVINDQISASRYSKTLESCNVTKRRTCMINKIRTEKKPAVEDPDSNCPVGSFTEWPCLHLFILRFFIMEHCMACRSRWLVPAVVHHY